jgi:Lrp/AsnC family leucine-responsive transcriptional regulator
MDAIDLLLIELLQKNARMTISDLSKKLNLSRPSIKERMFRLQEKGIIEGYSARISLKAIGRDILLFIQLRSLKVSPLTFEEKIANDPDILECHRVTGETDYFLKAAVHNMEGMRLLIDRLIPFGDLSSSIVIMSLIPYRPIVP